MPRPQIGAVCACWAGCASRSTSVGRLRPREARDSGADLDFIYGWPGQTIDQWRTDLNQVLGGEVGGRPPDHLSLYGLIVEPGTPMADAVQRGVLAPVDDDTAAGFHELAMSTAGRCGMDPL